MPTPLRVLILEDQPTDAELTVRELHRAGFAPDWQRVESEPAFVAGLSAPYDLILSDYRLPGFTALQALRHVRERRLDVPVIVLTGTLGDEEAVECMKQGAADYLLKDRLARLGQAVTRVLEERRLHRERRLVDQQLQVEHALARAVIESDSLDETIRRMLRDVGERLGWNWAALWEVDRVPNLLRCFATWHAPDITVQEFEAETQRLTVPHDIGFVGKVWASGRPAVLADMAGDPTALRAAVAHRDGLHGAFAFPIQLGGQVVGVVELLSREVRKPDDDLLRLVAAIGSHVGQCIDRKRVEEALRRSEEQHRLITENMSDLVAVLDVEGKRLYNSASYKHVLGDPELLRGTDSFADIHPDDREEVRRIFRETMATGVGHRTEFRFLLKDGSVRHVESQGSVIRDGTGAPARVIVVSRDISARKEADEALRKTEYQLRQAQKMEAVGLLAGGVAHDFNNLLTVINGYSDLLLQTLPADTPWRREIEPIKEAGKRAALLTQQILAFSRRQVLDPQIVDLNATIRKTETLLRRLIGEHIAVVGRYEPALGRVKVDPGQIEQVIMNLAVNARDAMPGGGTLTIETANVRIDEATPPSGRLIAPGAYVTLTMRDTGIGMDAATQTRIFEPFFTTKEQGKGTGLGLSTVYGIVKQSDGHILVDSKPGRGTAFVVYLPQATEEALPMPASSGSATAAGGTETILLVEDEEIVRSYIRTVLRQLGYVVLEASQGDEAMLFSDRYDGPIHLLVADMVMPGQSGPQVAERLVAARPGLKVLYLSGYTEHAAVRRGNFPSGTAFLPKPFTPDTLAQKVREILDREGPASP